MKLLPILTASAVLAFAPMTGFASLVTNGGFDEYQGNLAGGYYEHIDNGVSNSPLIPGWGVGATLVPGTAGVDLVRDNGPLYPAQSPNQFVDLNGTPGLGNIYQVLNTVANQEYVLRFAAVSTIPGLGGVGLWDGSDASGTNIVFQAINQDVSGSPLQWKWNVVRFVADSAQTFLAFGQWAPDGNSGVYVDSVSVNVVPEPATVFVWSVLGLAAAGVSYKRARKNAAVNS